MTKISHSLDRIKVEVFAEPNSKVCVYGSKPVMSTISHKGIERPNVSSKTMDNNLRDGSNHSNGKQLIHLSHIMILINSIV